ncbi:MAG: OmpA family protein [Bacteroidia bacterium]|nr:OmpA family protein [Bacteroidia bacterium]
MISYNKLVKLAEKTEKDGPSGLAVRYYECLRTYPHKNDDRLVYHIAELCRKDNDYLKAAGYYKMLADNNPSGYPDAIYYLAKMQKSAGMCDSAVINYKKYRQYETDAKYQAVSFEIENEIKGCQLRDSLLKVPSKVVSFRLDSTVNGPNSEFSPVILNDSVIIYGSLDPGLDGSLPVKKLYMAHKIDNGWKGGIELPGDINSRHTSVGNAAISPDGQRLYFTRCEKNLSGKVKCSLYMSRLADHKWSEPEMLPELVNNGNYTTTQPTIATDSKESREVVYFVSDRPGGKGGLDIWFTVYDKLKNEFSEPQNAGPKINTAQDEMTPFYHVPSHTLYFSSSGLPAVGNIDIYKTYGEKKNWNKPVNAGYPFNSIADDLYFVLNKSSQEGFFVSNRIENEAGEVVQSCCDDLFYFMNKDLIRIKLKGIVLADDFHAFNPGVTVSSHIYDTVPDADVDLYMLDSLTHSTTFIESKRSGVHGQFEFSLEPNKRYRLTAEKDKYLSGSDKVNTLKMMKSANLTSTIYLTLIPEKPVVMENIYYEFDKYDLTQESKNIIDSILLKIMNENPDISIELLSHTDSKGEDLYNMKLSQERAESVVNYLVEKGIDKSRLTAKGFGKTMPVAPNTNPDGSDNPDGRKKNRRTEFRIIRKQ